VFCDECGARLRPAASVFPEPEPVRREPVKGLSLPKKDTGELRLPPALAASGDISEDVPPWLEKLLVTHGLVMDREEMLPAAPGPEPAREPTPPAEREVESWLQDLRTEETEREPEIQEPPEPAPTAEEDSLDWLRDLREPDIEDTGAVAAPSEADLEEGALPAWLHDLEEPTVEAEPTSPPVEAPPEETLKAEEEELPDWLSDLGEPAVEAEPVPPIEKAPPLAETPKASEEELPDWLRGLDELTAEVEPTLPTEEAPPVVETPGTEEERLPEWLRDLGEPTVEAEPPPPVAEVVPDEDLEIEGEEPAEQILPPEEPPTVPMADEGELPAWLAELRGTDLEEEPTVYAPETPPSVEAPPAEEPGQVPDWLQDLDLTAGEGPSPEITPERPSAEAEEVEAELKPDVETPEWLQEIQRTGPTLTEEAPEEETTPPDWLAESETPDVTVETEEVPAPDWLQGPVPSAPAETIEEKEAAPPEWLQEVGASAPPIAEDEEPATAELPSWLEELQPAAEAPAAQVPPFLGEGGEETPEPPAPEAPVEGPEAEPERVDGLVRAEIPDWLLALRPQEPGEEPTEEPEIVELSGPLAHIKGVLPVEPVVSLPHLTRPEQAAVEVPPVSGDLLAEVVAQPSMQAAPVPRRKSTRVVAGVQRVLIYLLMLAAIVVPLLVGPIYGPLDAKDLESEYLQGGARVFYNLLNGQGALTLSADSVVLVVFDYHPVTAAELSLQAQVIVDHLMSRGLHIMAISLYPEGAALASDILDEVAQAHGYVYGENYIHLGYLPNQSTSVQSLLNQGPVDATGNDYRNREPVEDYAIAQGVDNFSAVRLVVNLAGDERTLQTWVEQMTAADSAVSMVAGVSAAIAPYVQPYLDSGQLKALLIGLPGAASYEAQTGRAGDAINSLGSQAAAQAVIILLMVMGNLVHLATRGGRK
jgi:hypothetical protein